jgi:ectoine hydroxylase-related dioxygenase (phytanoyl-CoA dioxygenase family)
MSPVGLRSEKGCAIRQKLKTRDPTSRQRVRPKSTNPQMSRNNQRQKGGKLVAGPRRVPDTKTHCRRNITLTLTDPTNERE